VLLIMIASVASGVFAGAAIDINAVEHPARLSCGTELAVREFGPSYRRATVMQGSLAVVGCLAGLAGGWQQADRVLVLAALVFGAVVPFTLLVILPTNQRLLDTALDPRGSEAATLLVRWGRLHAVRSALSTISFLMFLFRA
jgi:hypothetical protein